MEGLTKLEDVCLSLFNLRPEVARRYATLGKLPVPAFRLGGPKSPLFVRNEDLEALKAKRAEAAEKTHKALKEAEDA